MNFDELFAKRSGHIKPGLERIADSYAFLQRPAETIPTALVGGTNGKGSTSGFLWSLLASNPRQVALYSSPHLVEFSERFQLSQGRIRDEDVKAAWQQLEAELPKSAYADLSFFEIATLIAFRLFAARKAAFQVLEVGLGGRWDATNICDPLASIVVSVSLDHQEFLGKDILGIFGEKLGIMRPGRPLFWGKQGEVCAHPDHASLLQDRAAALGAPVYEREREFLATESMIEIHLPGLKTLRLPFQGLSAKLPQFLKDNLAISCAFYHWFQSAHSGWKALDEIWPAWCEGQGAAAVTLVGRSQRIRSPDGKRVLVDVCHNPDGARAFARSLQNLGLDAPIPALVSILKDKDFDVILDVLRSVLHPVILFGIEHERSWQPELLAARHRDLPFHRGFDDAWNALGSENTLAICGSVLVVGQALNRMAVSPKELSLARIFGGDWSPSSPDEPRSGANRES